MNEKCSENTAVPQCSGDGKASEGYPQLILMELRDCGTKPGNGLEVLIHWFEVFWSDSLGASSIALVTGYDQRGDNIYEYVSRAAKHPEYQDCFSFRGVVYDFCSFRSIKA
jgi:hypothetical protein